MIPLTFDNLFGRLKHDHKKQKQIQFYEQVRFLNLVQKPITMISSFLAVIAHWDRAIFIDKAFLLICPFSLV